MPWQIIEIADAKNSASSEWRGVPPVVPKMCRRSQRFADNMLKNFGKMWIGGVRAVEAVPSPIRRAF